MSDHQEHIVMLPFLALGHMIPFLALAKKIQERTNYKITIVSTPLNVKYLSSTIVKDSTQQVVVTQNPQNNISLVSLPYNSCEHGLPPNTENTEALPLKDMVTIFNSTLSLKEPLKKLIFEIIEKDGKPPLCIVSDTFMGFASEVAKSCATFNVSFTTAGAYGTAAYVSLWLNLPHLLAIDGVFKMPGFDDSCCFFSVNQLHPFMKLANGNDPWSKVLKSLFSPSLDSLGFLCNSVEEIEPMGVKAIENLTKLPVWCIGPLLPQCMLKKGEKGPIFESKNGKDQIFESRNGTDQIFESRIRKEHGLSPEKCIEWLNKHPQSSVLYISFGSQNTISTSQMMALALGLEDSERPFIWVIRPPIGFDIKGEFRSEWLPKGFQERVSKSQKGLIVKSWAPQLQILSHSSTGAFLTHCGWNSVLESLSQGVPIISWPLAAEQAFNSKMLMEEMGVCVELTKGFSSDIEKEVVKKVVEIVLGKSGKGKEMKEKANEIGMCIRAAVTEEGDFKGSSVKALDDFISTLLYRRNMSS
ncbi:UDP-glycosyltransferase 92A1-like [Solanum dulcamara]|uniref:UDP-glycosyltransferase 92A1-like n=1 Tax=Solanum dulcamara TaxID=45834 RepID=UPI0024852FA5|nr:UDP-glycosyltransferase 92A1-like [Solanum dulcamara]